MEVGTGKHKINIEKMCNQTFLDLTKKYDEVKSKNYIK